MSKTPKDIVPPTGPTREQILWANKALGGPVRVVQPGMVIQDPHGLPIAVGPDTVLSDMTLAAPLTYTRGQLAAAGVDLGEVPNVRVVN